jgi:signal transduction histidine kinase
MPFIGLAIFYGVTRGLTPLRELATQITERSPYQMSPIDSAKAPKEVKGIVTSLNNLLARLEEAIEGERRFTANASHELRTPLAAIQVQCQVALRAEGHEERDKALLQISQSVDRATRMVTQLLTLARLDPETAEGILKPVNLRRLLEEEVAEVSPSAFEKNIEIGLECPSDVTINADSESLLILARNLLDNAIRYTPEGGGVTTVVEEEGDEVRLSITDTGPGIPSEERDKVLDRFYRIVGSASSGAGLGLSIVSRIAELHGARLELSDNRSQGLTISVIFPRDHGPVSA